MHKDTEYITYTVQIVCWACCC